MKRMAAAAAAGLLLVGCSANSTSRAFDVPFEAAAAKVQTLYPSVLAWREVDRSLVKAQIEGPKATIARDEASHAGEITFYVLEGETAIRRRTEIAVRSLDGNRSSVSVQTSKSNKSVVFPSRDTAYEQARLAEISDALK